MHVPRQRQPEGWVAIGYAYRHWKQALSRRAGIDKKDATPKQITTFQERVDVLSASKEMAQATKRAMALSEAIEASGWTDELNGISFKPYRA